MDFIELKINIYKCNDILRISHNIARELSLLPWQSTKRTYRGTSKLSISLKKHITENHLLVGEPSVGFAILRTAV